MRGGCGTGAAGGCGTAGCAGVTDWPGAVNTPGGGAPPGSGAWLSGNPGLLPGRPGVVPGRPGVVPGRPGVLPGSPGTGRCGGGTPSDGGVPGIVGVSPGKPVPGGTVAAGGLFVRPGNRLVSPAIRFVRNRLVPVNRLDCPRFVGVAGFTPTTGEGGNSGARSLNWPLLGACANALPAARRLKSVSRVFITSLLSTGCTYLPGSRAAAIELTWSLKTWP
jgi:hypothetical protein